MRRNESTTDRAVRAVVGATLVGTGLLGLGASGYGIALAALGGVLLVTAATGYCALYDLLGIRTCRSC